MTIDDFKLLTTLPPLYDYSIYEHDGAPMIIGKNHQEVIGFKIIKNELRPIKFEPIRYVDDYR